MTSDDGICRGKCRHQQLAPFIPLPQVNQAASQDTLDNSYEALLQPPAQAEYRPAIVESRAFLLKTALDNLSDVQKRRQYDSQIATGPAQVTDSVEAGPSYNM